jgi:transposase
MTFILTGGERHASMLAEALLEPAAVKRPGRGQPRRRPKRLVADKADGKPTFRQFLRRRGMRVTIPRKTHERRRAKFDQSIYRQRNQVERFFNRLKQCRRVATRYEKRAVNYLAMITLAAILIWL